MPGAVQKEWETDLMINARGVAVDMALVRGALDLGNAAHDALTEEAARISGLDNPNSIRQLSAWLEEEMDEELPSLAKENVAKLLSREDNSDAVRRVLEIRQELGKTSTKKYDAIEAAVCADGRVRGLFQFYGANRTGRFAGRLVQVQNLPRTQLESLDLARELVAARQADALRLVYGGVPNTLSQLIRTCFVAPPGRILIDADFAAIEARVLAWLAGEQWKLDVFRTHGKIYEAAASQMFGVPIDKIVKGNPEYVYRQRGKVAELGLGYAMGAAKFKDTAEKQYHIAFTEEEAQDIVNRWREANKRIRDLWYAMNSAAAKVVAEGGSAGVGHVLFSREYDRDNGLDCMTILLPSGRKLYYVGPTMVTDRWGGPSVGYMGMDTKQWSRIETYGGRLVENCLAEDSLVLTDTGWTRIDQVSTKQRLWDGAEWVSHSGLIRQGVKNTVSLNGVRMTPEHLVMTEMGWRNASSCAGYNEHPAALPDGRLLRGLERKKISVENSLRLRERIHHASKRISERQTKILRMYDKKTDRRCNANPRNDRTPSLLGLALNARPLPAAYTSSLGKLRRTRYSRLREVADRFYEFLDGHGANLPEGPYLGSNRRKRQLLSRKLPLGNLQNPGKKQAKQHADTDALGNLNSGGSGGTVWNRRHNPTLPNSTQLVPAAFVLSPGRYEPVCDLLDAGPRNCFTVMGVNGPFIVHNCTQAVARDCLACAIERLEAAGYAIVMHCHDEVVVETDAADAEKRLEKICALMSEPMPWAPDLPLAADGWTSPYFKKG
jgi:hypothetical protein